MSAVEPREKRLAEAVAILVEAIHHDVPGVSTRPLAPYDDEDFTLEVRIPAGMDRDTVMDLCIRPRPGDRGSVWLFDPDARQSGGGR